MTRVEEITKHYDHNIRGYDSSLAYENGIVCLTHYHTVRRDKPQIFYYVSYQIDNTLWKLFSEGRYQLYDDCDDGWEKNVFAFHRDSYSWEKGIMGFEEYIIARKAFDRVVRIWTKFGLEPETWEMVSEMTTSGRLIQDE